MFRAPLCSSSGSHDDGVWLPHRPSGSRVAAGCKLSAGRMDECPDRRLLFAAGWKLSAGRIDECPDRRLLQPSVRTLIHPACT